jgi:DNA-binding NarL/FixJ family response regulator
MSAVRVLVVDDQRLIRDGIASLLAIQDGVEVVGTAADGREAIELARTLRPDVVLMDVRMPILDGVAATSEIRRQVPSCQVLMLTTFDDETYAAQALRAGASGYLLKDVPAPELAQAVRLVKAGIYQFDPGVADRLLRAGDHADNPAPGPVGEPPERLTAAPPRQPAGQALTDRELTVLKLLATGATNREIATRLVVSEGTVKNHVSSILGRLGLRDRTQAALYARDHGLL